MNTLSYDQLTTINFQCNKDIVYCTDLAQYHKADYWCDGLDTKMGDCEDYAIAKLHQCLAAGASIESLRLATCMTENNDSHAVLIATDLKGDDYILDNRAPYPTLVEDTAYTDWKIQDAGSKVWRKAVIN